MNRIRPLIAAVLALGAGGPVAAAHADSAGGAQAPAAAPTPASSGGATPTPAPSGTTTTPTPPATAPAPAPAPAGTHLGDRLPLRRGMKGPDVTELQQALTRVGQTASADGDFGPGTFRALSAWEAAAHRKSDGVLKAGDLSALRKAAAKAPPPSEPPPPAPATATITAGGKAIAPASAPAAVAAIVTAANKIAKTPYRYGGGHQSFTDTAYDCSGSVSYALHGAGLLNAPWDSTMLETFGAAGPGTWVTIYANAEHTFMVIAGIRYDTSGQRQAGTRWQPISTRSYGGFVVRHPVGL